MAQNKQTKNVLPQEEELLHIFEEFIEKVNGEKSLSVTALRKVDRFITEAWKQTPYKLEIAMDYSFAKALLFDSEMEIPYLKELMAACQIKVTQKDEKKKGKRGYLERFNRNFYRPRVQELIRKNVIIMALQHYISQLNEHPDINTLNSVIENIGFDAAQALVYSVLQDKPLITLMKKERYRDDIAGRVRLYLHMEKINFKHIMTEPSPSTSKKLDVNHLQKRYSSLQTKIIKDHREKQQLKQKLYKAEQEKKKLKGVVHTIEKDWEQSYQEAQETIEGITQQFAEERQVYLATIERLTRQLDGVPEPSREVNLQQQTICLIGGSKERHFREIVEAYNGKFLFVSADDTRKIEGTVSRADAVFFLSELVSHENFHMAYQAAKNKNIPFIYLNSKGTTSFEREIQYFISKLN